MPAKASLTKPEIDLEALPAGLTPSKLPVDFQLDSLPALNAPYRSDFGLSMSHPSRAVKAEELFDVHQQADFFVSIGQHEQAIDVLRNHVGDDAETSALVYLDLFNLYNQLGRKSDYEALREDFNGRFNTKIPEFESYTVAGPGLEAYQSALLRIQALWPSPKVLEVIEDSIFKRPENDSEAFSLQAYRELLMLYSVAKGIIGADATSANEFGESGRGEDTYFSGASTAAELQHREFVPTGIQPLSASIGQTNASNSNVFKESRLPSKTPPTLTSWSLDLDLSEPAFEEENRFLTASTGVQNSNFFERPAAEVNETTNLLPKNSAQAAEQSSDSSSNLLDFDSFDIPLTKHDLPKPPKM